MPIYKHDNQQQQKFDLEYITVGEICETYNVRRSSIRHARETGRLPGPIVVGTLFIWNRAAVQPFLEQWVSELQGRRNA